jgi:hypothetical protein
LLSFLRGCGYAVTHLDGSPVEVIDNYGHLMAVPA